MREGYKETAVGWIPEDWEVVKLGDVLVRSPEYGAGAASIPYSDETYRYVRITDIDDSGKIIEENKVGIVKEDGEQYLLRERDVLIARTGNTVGKSYFHNPKNGDCAFAGYLIRFNLDEKKYNPYFFFHFVHSPMYWIWVRNTLRTGAQPNINSQEYQGLKLPRPPLAEQSKIASILSTVDDKIDSINKRIEKTRKLKQGMMQRLLTQGIGHTKFKDSPLGRIPEGWEVVPLIKTADVKGRIGYRGYTKEDLVEKGQGALTIGAKHINVNSQLVFNDPEYIKWEKYEESPEIKVKVGDILIVQRGSIGKLALVNYIPEPATINPSMVLLKNIKCNSSFLYFFLSSDYIQGMLKKIVTSTAVPMISQDQIKNLLIAVPCDHEQNQIAYIITSINDKIENLQEEKSEYENMKQGLMQQLLTGKMRVTI